MIAFEGEMPQGCGGCPLSYLDRDEDDLLIDVCCLTNHHVWNDFTERAEDCPLIEVPSTQKTGHWIIFPPCFEEICMCSNCKTKFKEAYQHRDTCPNCGARMEV